MKNARIIQLPKIADSRGNLSIVEQWRQCPFEIKRVHWIYDVPGGMERGGHAFRSTKEIIVALSGSFDVVLDDGNEQETFSLNRSYFGLYVPQGIWRTMTNFSTNSLALVLSSTEYNESDYIFNHEEFCHWKAQETSFQASSALSHSPAQSLLPSCRKSVWECSLCELDRVHDTRGNLTFIYERQHVPFPINRVFYSYDIPGGESRGAHAHKHCHQFVIAASGSFEVVLDDGSSRRTVQLNRPFRGLHIPPGIWASEQGFSSGSICLVLASEGYDADDYIADYAAYLEYIRRNGQND